MRDFFPLNQQHCYACLNWDGNRTVYHKDNIIKADDHEKANCSVFHELRMGRQECDKFNPIL